MLVFIWFIYVSVLFSSFNSFSVFLFDLRLGGRAGQQSQHPEADLPGPLSARQRNTRRWENTRRRPPACRNRSGVSMRARALLSSLSWAAEQRYLSALDKPALTEGGMEGGIGEKEWGKCARQDGCVSHKRHSEEIENLSVYDVILILLHGGL